jgi:hypothetical protein
MVVFEFDVVGGPFDGAPHLRWRADGRHPCPPTIIVGTCENGACGSEVCRGKEAAHVSYWTVEERAGAPKDALAYSKQDEAIGTGEDGELAGRATYAVGGLLDDRNFRGRVALPTSPAPLVTAEFEPATYAGSLPRRHHMCPCVIVPVHDALTAPPGSLEASWNDFGDGR